MRFLVILLLTCFSVLAAGCGEPPEESTEVEAEAISAQALWSDGDVHFLPPLGWDLWTKGKHFVGDVPVSVRVEDASGAVVASWDSSKVRRLGSKQYLVEWKIHHTTNGEFTIIVSTPARDVGSVRVRVKSWRPFGWLIPATVKVPVIFRVERAAVDEDGDGTRDWEDRCPALAHEADDDLDCDGLPDEVEEPTDPEPTEPTDPEPPVGVRITAPGEAYGHQGSCSGWNGCGDAATCALWACLVNGYTDVVAWGAEAPCTQFTTCNLLDGPDVVEMDWGNFCDVMGVTDIDCAP